MKHYKIANKMLVIFFGVMIPNLQAGIIGAFATGGLISGGDDYPAYMLGVFTSSILICSEMIALGFLAHFLYPVQDFMMNESFISSKPNSVN